MLVLTSAVSAFLPARPHPLAFCKDEAFMMWLTGASATLQFCCSNNDCHLMLLNTF